MTAARISLLDFTGSLELGNSLREMVAPAQDMSAVVHHELFNGTDVAESLGQLAAILLRTRPDLVIVLWSREAQLAAPRVFGLLLGQKHTPPVVVVPFADDPAAISELFRLGASDYLIPPFRPADVRPRLQRLLAAECSREKSLANAKASLGLQKFVGESPVLMEQIRKIPQIARCNACVLITGETGTGKEVCARAIHYLSPRSAHPFVPLNCGAIPPDLLENELFGHEIGAFTSANSSHNGVIGQAQGGTLFLDEIDSLPLVAQVKLLRFLQDKEYRPLGAAKARKADVRIIAAANARIQELLKTARMREDLFYRLNVLPLHLPPLRQRKEDIPLLARHFVTKYAAGLDSKACDITTAALRKLSLHDWPGNVRELENVVERAVILCAGDTVLAHEIDLPVCPESPLETESFRLLKARAVAEFEQNYLRSILERHQGNIGHAARAAHKNRRVFFGLMRKHHIRVERDTTSAGGRRVAKIVIVMDKYVHPLPGA